MRAATLLLPLLLAGPVQAAEPWPELPPPKNVGGGSKDVALLIAIEDYAEAQDIPGALKNAQDWDAWLRKARGVRRVKRLINNDATREEILAAAEGLARQAQPGGRVWVIFIGHGAPSQDGDDGILVGWDAQQTARSLQANSVTRSELIAALDGPQAETVLVLDACFSGKTSTGDLAPGLSPLKAVGTSLGSRVTALTAATGGQYAGPLSDGRRPAFTYLLLGALRGWGDSNGDGVVSAREAVDYADGAIYETVTGRTQTPMLEGPDVALGRSGKEAAPDLAAFTTGFEGTGGAVRIERPADPGQAEIEFDGEAVDFGAMAAQAEAARKARQAAEASARAAAEEERRLSAALKAEKARRIEEAISAAQKKARKDYEAIEGLVKSPTEEGRPVLAAWLKRYESPTVTLEGERVTVPPIREVALVKAALGRVSSTPGNAGRSTAGSSGYRMVSIPGGRFTMGSSISQSD